MNSLPNFTHISRCFRSRAPILFMAFPLIRERWVSIRGSGAAAEEEAPEEQQEDEGHDGEQAQRHGVA